MKNNKFVAFFIFFILTILYPKDKIFFATSLDPSISFGRDSNVMRFSQNEINQMASTPYLLPPNNISSRFIKFSTTFRFYSKSTLLSYMFNNRRTNFFISGNYTLNIDHHRKSSKNFSFKIDQQLGNYKHIYIGYFIMPNYYLREYEDLDLSVTIYEMYEQILSEIEDEYGCYTNQCEEYNDVLNILAPLKLNIQVIHPAVKKDFLQSNINLDDFQGVAWTGSTLNIYDQTPPIIRQIELAKLLLSKKNKIFGSCWGLQVLSTAVGGIVDKNTKGLEAVISKNIKLNNKGLSHRMYLNKPKIFDAFCQVVKPEVCI